MDELTDRFKRSLAVEGLRIAAVPTGGAGLSLAVRGGYDAIIVGLDLPDLHGFSVLERLRTFGLTVPTVLLAQDVDRHIQAHARAAGATALWHKPLNPREAAKLLRAVVPLSFERSLERESATVGQLQGAVGNDAVFCSLASRLKLLGEAARSNRASPRPVAVIAQLLAAMVDHRLTLGGFAACARAAREALNAPAEVDAARMALSCLETLNDTHHPKLKPEHPAVRLALDKLLETPRWWAQEGLARELGVSRSHLARLISSDLGVGYRTLRRLVIMRLSLAEVLLSAEQVAQIAHRFEMHPGSLDRDFKRTFGRSPRELRGLWRNARN